MTRRNGIGCPDNLDPRQVNIDDKPKRCRKPVRRKREPMPEAMKSQAEQAAVRKAKRPLSPGIMLEPRSVGEGNDFDIVSPHDDDEAWLAMIADAFGTRSWAVIKTFGNHLRGLCSEAYDHANERWKPNEQELNAALAILTATRPKDEFDAMIAAQAVATHWMQMRAAKFALRNSWDTPDERTAATCARLSRTFLAQVEAIDKRKRKPKTTRQTISVKRENHIHHHKHIHIEGGAEQIGGQVYGARAIEASAQVPSDEPGAQLVRLPCGEGQAGVSPPRRGQGKRSAEG